MGQAILLDIVEEHLEEADFLWSHRQSVLPDRGSTLYRLAELEERLLAHLGGLVLLEDAVRKHGVGNISEWIVTSEGSPRS